MLLTRYRNMLAGTVPGMVSLLLTFHLQTLFHADPNIAVRITKAVGIALVIPGLIAAILAGDAHSFRLSLAATVNFVFWFGFGWLVAIFIQKLVELRRAIAAVEISGDTSSSHG
jgi:hypothetical protein